jgi:5-methyltetrahydrofolate--homocysteine methyltransferase
MDILTDEARRGDFIAKRHREAITIRDRELAGETETTPVVDTTRSKVRQDVPVVTPPFWGYTVLDSRHIPIDEVFDCLDLKSLFRLSWGAHKLHGAEYERIVAEELMPRLKRMQAELRGRQILTPRVIYGYFPCHSEGNDLLVYEAEASAQGASGGRNGSGPQDKAQESKLITRFTFPRQPDRERLCLADYYASVESGRLDVVPLQVVTMGDRASEVFMQMQAEGNYAEGYYIYGLSVALAEALAEWTHRRIVTELGLPPGQGRRYSWGYPACPDPAEQTKLMQILPAESTIGVSLTEGSVLVPEQSTAALVAHHPQAKYYTTRPLNKGRAVSEAEEEAEGRGYVEPEVASAV